MTIKPSRILAVLLVLGTLGCVPELIVHPPSDPLRQQQTDQWLSVIQEHAQPGDWLVIRGYTPSDNLVVAATNIPLSHVAVLDKEKARVIEAVGKGVQFVKLRKFIQKSHRLLLVRPMWWSPKKGARAVKRASSAVGRSYDFMGTIGGGNPDQFYCSELAVLIYGPHGPEKERFPTVWEPGQMYLWGTILFDSRPRN